MILAINYCRVEMSLNGGSGGKFCCGQQGIKFWQLADWWLALGTGTGVHRDGFFGGPAFGQ
jgi:hypothetical protein